VGTRSSRSSCLRLASDPLTSRNSLWRRIPVQNSPHPYTRHGLGPPAAQRLDLPKQAPCALNNKDITQWLRTVERWLSPRDRALALIPFYAGLRIGETVALDVDDIQLTARKGLIVVRSGKRNHYRELPVHADLHGDLKLWIDDERPHWPGADTNPALLL
jgi:site-specific recombinase XerC